MSTSTLLLFFFFNDTATTEIYTLSLHDALPISSVVRATTMLASPDQIIRSTATNSTCRVATTLLGVHRPAVRVAASGADTATGRAHSIHRARAVRRPVRRPALEGLGAAAVQQRPAAHTHPRTADGRGRGPLVGVELAPPDVGHGGRRRPAP